MTGPEHYKESERLANMHRHGSQDWAAEWGNQTLAAAQVHATLALTAATARIAIAGSDSDSANEWRRAVHGRPL